MKLGTNLLSLSELFNSYCVLMDDITGFSNSAAAGTIKKVISDKAYRKNVFHRDRAARHGIQVWCLG